MASGPDTVRAARLIELGQPLQIEEVELPSPGEDEVRVDLHYGGVNPIDRYNAAGQVNPDAVRPRTLGGEAAGEVDGRLVLVAGEGLGFVRDGLWSQAAVVPREAVVDVPDGVAPEHAAAMGIAGLTALNCVRTLARRHRRGSRRRARSLGRRREHDRLPGSLRRRHRVGPDRLGGQGGQYHGGRR